MRIWQFTAVVHSPDEGGSRQYGEVEAPTAEAAAAEVRKQQRAQGRECGPVDLIDDGRSRR